MKKIDKLKKFFCKSYSKKISEPLIQPSISRPERTERSYLIHAITLRGATTLCARLDIKARYAHFSLSPPPSYIWRSNREEPPRLSAILYPPTRARRDAVLPPPESSRLLHPFFPRYPFFLHLLVCPWRRGDNFSRRLSSIRPSFVGWQRTTRSPRTR